MNTQASMGLPSTTAPLFVSGAVSDPRTSQQACKPSSLRSASADVTSQVSKSPVTTVLSPPSFATNHDGRIRGDDCNGITAISAEDLEVFWSRVDKTDDCWFWTRGKTRGYGRFFINGRVYLAHRIAYTLLVGPIPLGLEIDHICRNPGCVRPDHLEPVTHRVNIQRAVSA